MPSGRSVPADAGFSGKARACGHGAAVSRASNPCAPTRRNRPSLRQQRLKALSRTAGARIAAAELLDQLLLAATDEAETPLHPCLGREALTTLGGDLESRGGRHACSSSSSPPLYRRVSRAGGGPLQGDPSGVKPCIDSLRPKSHSAPVTGDAP